MPPITTDEDLLEELSALLSPTDLDREVAYQVAIFRGSAETNTYTEIELALGDDPDNLARELTSGNKSNEEVVKRLSLDMTNAVSSLQSQLVSNMEQSAARAQGWGMGGEWDASEWWSVLQSSFKDGYSVPPPESMASYWRTIFSVLDVRDLNDSDYKKAPSDGGDWGIQWSVLISSISDGTLDSKGCKRAWLDELTAMGRDEISTDAAPPITGPFSLARKNRHTEIDCRPNAVLVAHTLELTRQRGLSQPENSILHQWATQQPEYLLSPTAFPWAVRLEALGTTKGGAGEKHANAMSMLWDDIMGQVERQPEIWSAWALTSATLPLPPAEKWVSLVSRLNKWCKEAETGPQLDILDQLTNAHEFSEMSLGRLRSWARQRQLDALDSSVSSSNRTRPRSRP